MSTEATEDFMGLLEKLIYLPSENVIALFKAIGGKEYTGLRRIFVHLRGAEMGA